MKFCISLEFKACGCMVEVAVIDNTRGAKIITQIGRIYSDFLSSSECLSVHTKKITRNCI